MKYLWFTLYIAAILLANITLNNFIEFPVFGMLSVGTLFFGAIFTIRDRLHLHGMRFVIFAIAVALLVNTIYAVAFDTPIRFIIASFLAILISELTDTVIFQRLKKRSWIARVMTSNSVSIPLDSILFALIAFYGDLSNYDILQIIITDIVFKTIIASLIAMNFINFKSWNFNKQPLEQ